MAIAAASVATMVRRGMRFNGDLSSGG